jgi:two-component system, chemotaxis family, sensor kinase Cph1
VSISPAFGQADMTNCERELIQFAGSIQPHGMLLVLQAPQWRIVQASRTAALLLDRPLDWLLLKDLSQLDGELAAQIRLLAAGSALQEPQPLRCRIGGADFEGAVHRVGEERLVLELERVTPPPPLPPRVEVDGDRLLEQLGPVVQRISEAATILPWPSGSKR